MPWDYTLLAMQGILVHIIVPLVVGIGFVGSIHLYVIGGHDEKAGRLFGSALGGGIALALVHLLNYVAF